MQHLRRALDDPRVVGGDVDDDVPGAAAKRRQVLGPVAVQLLHLREELRVRPAAVEERHLLSASERRLGDGAAEKPGPAENQDLHQGFRSIARQTASAPNRTASAGTRSSAAWSRAV